MVSSVRDGGKFARMLAKTRRFLLRMAAMNDLKPTGK